MTNSNNDEKLGNKNVSPQGSGSRSVETVRDRVVKMLTELGSSIAEVRYVSAVKIEELKPLEQYRLTTEVTTDLSSTIRATAKFVGRDAILVDPIILSEDSFIIDGVKRTEVLKDLGMESVNAIVIEGLKCSGAQINRLRCLGLRVALNTARWDSITVVDRRKIIFEVAREALKTLSMDEVDKIKGSIGRGEVPRSLVDLIVKSTGMPYTTVYRSLQYIITVPGLKSALLGFEGRADIRDEVFNLSQSIVEKLKGLPEDARNELINKVLEGEVQKGEVDKVIEKVTSPQAVVETTTGGEEKVSKEEHEEKGKEEVERAIAEVRSERFLDRVTKATASNVKDLIALIKAGSVDEDRIFAYELRRQYPEDLLRPIFLVLDAATRLFEDLIFPDKAYLYTLAQQIERINVVFGEKDVIPTWFRLMCGVAISLGGLPQFADQRGLVKTICTAVISELNKYEEQRKMGGQL
jgi:hypothetical protein